jgi:hypothetical protein
MVLQLHCFVGGDPGVDDGYDLWLGHLCKRPVMLGREANDMALASNGLDL